MVNVGVYRLLYDLCVTNTKMAVAFDRLAQKRGLPAQALLAPLEYTNKSTAELWLEDVRREVVTELRALASPMSYAPEYAGNTTFNPYWSGVYPLTGDIALVCRVPSPTVAAWSGDASQLAMSGFMTLAPASFESSLLTNPVGGGNRRYDVITGLGAKQYTEGTDMSKLQKVLQIGAYDQVNPGLSTFLITNRSGSNVRPGFIYSHSPVMSLCWYNKYFQWYVAPDRGDIRGVSTTPFTMYIDIDNGNEALYPGFNDMRAVIAGFGQWLQPTITLLAPSVDVSQVEADSETVNPLDAFRR
jgi:hypothetical protein